LKSGDNSTGRIFSILEDVRALASEYRALTGKPLGVTGEVAEYHAARLLNLELAEARTPGYDALRRTTGRDERIQIKGRVILPDSKPGQRLGMIKRDAPCDAVVLVLMDEGLEPTSILEADFDDVRARLDCPGSKARARGSLSLSEFKRLAREVWRRDR